MNGLQDLVPHIPEESPFTEGQRAWLNGFLAGLYSYSPVASEKAAPLRVALLYASQTGTAEGLARKLAKEMKAAGFEVVINSLEGYVPATLAKEKHALFIASTYGEGEAPDASSSFFEQLCIEHFPLLGDLNYSLVSLGDSHYEQFCQFGKDLDAKLQNLGASRLLSRVDCDVEYDVPYTAWKQEVISKLREVGDPNTARDVTDTVATASDVVMVMEHSERNDSVEPMHTRENPYFAPVAEKRELTHVTSSKSTIHVGFDIRDSGMEYEAGDACGVLPKNCPELVDSILIHLPFTGNEIVEVPKVGSMTLAEALASEFTVTRISRKVVAKYAEITDCKKLKKLLEPNQLVELEQYLYGRDLMDLLQECPSAVPSPEALIEMLPRLAPRLYSISSSPAAHPGRVHATVSVVRYRTHERERKGVCSTLMADRINAGESLPVYIHANKKFRLPADRNVPIMMVGPGTGIAPFRGFLHERQAVDAKGKNWLFFGERSAATDFLYRNEIEKMLNDKHLTRFDVAFSRDQEQKIYVQDLMRKNARDVWAWLQEGACFYVCGDASRMAKDVDLALQSIVMEQGGLTADATEVYMQELKDDGRYQRDVY